MTSDALVQVLVDARSYVARPGNDFSWSSWRSTEDALRELDAFIAQARAGRIDRPLDLETVFAVTGPMQELSLSSGWGKEFVALATRFDAAFVRREARRR